MVLANTEALQRTRPLNIYILSYCHKHKPLITDRSKLNSAHSDIIGIGLVHHKTILAQNYSQQGCCFFFGYLFIIS